MRQCACSRRPADFYAGLRHYPLVWRWWFSRGVGSNKDATTASASTAPRHARSNREDYAEQKLALAVSNNVGAEIAKTFFASMTYAFGALGGTRTPTILLTATSRQRVYQFRHERLCDTGWSDAARRINGADVTNQGWGDKAVLRLDNYLTSGDFGSICLTSTAIRLRSTSTTPEATGRLLARILTSSASVASSSMMAPRESRITWWMGMVVVPSTTMRSTLTLSRVATSEPPNGD